MPRKTWERSAALLRTLPGKVILKAAGHCDGHTILNPKAFTDAGVPDDVVTFLTRTHQSDGSPKGSLFVDGKLVKSLQGIYGLEALRCFASALGVEYEEAMGRGFEARNIHIALRRHFASAEVRAVDNLDGGQPGGVMMAAPMSEKTTLYFRQGGSDKVYQAAIEPSGERFIVTFAFGRRGTTLTTGTKTAAPVDYVAARKIYDKLLAEKTGKGYTTGEGGIPYQHTNKEDRSTGIVPQLLNPIDEDQARQLLSDDDWLLQEKFDGRRLLVRRTGPDVVGINRTGLVVALPMAVVTAVLGLEIQSCLLDGEAVGEVFHAFDLMEHNGRDHRTMKYADRLSVLVDLVDAIPTDAIRHASTATGTRAKQQMLQKLRDSKREGGVFKRADAAYTPGRPASGGTQLKLKFTASASCIVKAVSIGKRSVALELRDGRKAVAVGNVTIPANHPIPTAGGIVEIRYLYAYPGGSLNQPVYLGIRDDIPASACTLSQLKFKADADEG